MKSSVVVDVSQITSPDKVVTYIPIVTSFVYILGMVGTVVHHRELYLSALTLLLHGFIIGMCIFSAGFTEIFMPVHTSSTPGKALQTKPLVILVFLWLIHGSLLRSSEVLIDGELAVYAGVIQSFVILASLVPRCTNRLAYTTTLAVISFVVFVFPAHDHNVFHVSADKTYFRLILAYVLYWMFSIESMVNLNTCIAAIKNGGLESLMAIDSQQRHYFVRNIVRSAWPLFCTNPGLIAGIFMLIVYTSIRSVTRLPVFIAYFSNASFIVRVDVDAQDTGFKPVFKIATDEKMQELESGQHLQKHVHPHTSTAAATATATATAAVTQPSGVTYIADPLVRSHSPKHLLANSSSASALDGNRECESPIHSTPPRNLRQEHSHQDHQDVRISKSFIQSSTLFGNGTNAKCT